MAEQRGLQLGCSPVSFWGEAQQTVAQQLRLQPLASPSTTTPSSSSSSISAPSSSLSSAALPLPAASTIGTVRTVTADVLCGSWEPEAMRLNGWKRHRRFGIGSLRVRQNSIPPAFSAPVDPGGVPQPRA